MGKNILIVYTQLMDREELFKKALAYLNQAEYQSAWDLFLQLKEIPLDDLDLAFQLAECCIELDKQEELKIVIDFIQNTAPNDPRLHIVLAKMDFIKKQYRQSLRHLRKALKLAPNNATAYYNIGFLLHKTLKFHSAKKFFLHSLELKPNQTASYINLGLIAKYLGEYADIPKYYQKAIALEPKNSSAHMYLGMYYLTEEQYQQGWSGYEWRLLTSGFKNIQKRYEKPRWQGESLQGKRLIIFTEQGFGDAIQFVRYLSLIDKAGGEIYLECKDELVRLFKNTPAIDGFVKRLGKLPRYDYYFPLLSLPLLFKTDASNIPHHVPYLTVNHDDKCIWRDFLADYNDSFKIGIIWAGSQTHGADVLRSINPELFKGLLGIPKVTLFSLQKEGAEQLCKQHGFIPCGHHFRDFMDTAACIEHLDLVISVDTAVVHLAGALNKPVWTLISFVHDWRWGRDKTTSPWYPSMRLFRQKKAGDWRTVFDEVFDALSSNEIS